MLERSLEVEPGLATPASQPTMKAWVYSVLEGDPDAGPLAWIFSFSMIVLIVLNIVAVVLQSVDWVDAAYRDYFFWFEACSVFVFSLEYVARLWSCTVEPQYRGAVRGRMRFARTPLAVIDLVAIVPFYIPAVVVDLRILRMVRLLRLTRLFKLGRYSAALHTIRNVFVAKKEELAVSVLITLLLMLLGSGLLYICEHEAQPEAFASIPAALWWATVTLSTVDYIDVRPITPLGRVLGVALALLDLSLLAVPTGILGSGFVEEFQRRREPRACPSCGVTLPRDL